MKTQTSIFFPERIRGAYRDTVLVFAFCFFGKMFGFFNPAMA